eukprot:gene31022-38904_t
MDVGRNREKPWLQPGDYRTARPVHERESGLPPLYNATYNTSIFEVVENNVYSVRFYTNYTFADLADEICAVAESGTGTFSGVCKARVAASSLLVFKADAYSDIDVLRATYASYIEYCEYDYKANVTQTTYDGLWNVDDSYGLFFLDRVSSQGHPWKD